MSSTQVAKGQQQRSGPCRLMRALGVVGFALGVLAEVLSSNAWAQTRLPETAE
ncbi:MAG TPA: hypothetical protein VLM91_21045 [Candidatus Methylomirabilis sp.]|nr:hypothetical protein [Candidatus Methylomirabilis sp.]